MRAWMVLVLVGALAACQGRSPPSPSAAVSEGGALVPASAPAEDAARVISMTHDFFRDFDRNDAARVGQVLADRFALVDHAYFTPREQLLKAVTAREHEKFPVILERSWSDESVRFFGGTAVFTGFTSARLLRDPGAKEAKVDRYVTHVWVWQDARWQLAHWQSEDAGIDAEREVWNEFFRSSKDFSLKPNGLLVETVRGRKPGTALDAGMGQGRNAVFLASQGWKVTGVDISDEGLRQAKEAATREGVSIDAVNADLASYDLGEQRWDLICWLYMGTPDRVEALRKSLRQGGIVVVEYVPKGKAAPLRKLFGDGWKVLRDDEVEDQPDYGKVRATVRRFVAQKL